MSQNIDARARRQASLCYDLIKDLMTRVTDLETHLEGLYDAQAASSDSEEE